ncbi:MAG TPA: glycosyltransferase family 9 protein [Thermoleophilaceae bacterium]
MGTARYVSKAATLRVLFIRPDHIGDLLLTFPAVAALRRVIPAAHLTYAAPADAVAAAERCPSLDAALTVPFPPFGRDGSCDVGWRETVRAEAAKLLGRFDAALVVRPDDPWSAELVGRASIPIRLGFDMPRTRPHLTDVLPVHDDRHVALDGFDLVDALLARLSVSARAARVLDPSLVVSRDDEEEVDAVLADEGAHEPLIVLHPGSGWPLKNWPASRWWQLVVELARRTGTRPLLAGTAHEEPLVRRVVEATPAINLAGRLSLGALAALHKRARLVVTTDSGALHLAAAMGAPVVGIFGPGDPFRFAPLAPPSRVRVVRLGLPCSPCGTLEHPPCGAVRDPACVSGITVRPVVEAATELLRAPRPAPRGLPQRTAPPTAPMSDALTHGAAPPVRGGRGETGPLPAAATRR